MLIKLPHEIAGASLTELLVAMAISLWLVAGILWCYISYEKTYRLNQALARMQENGRMAMQLLSQDIMRAGYAGCLPLKNLALRQVSSAGATTQFSAENSMAGWRNFNSTSDFLLPSDITDIAASESDILLIQAMLPDDAAAISAVNKDSVTFSQNAEYKPGDILLIADCRQADIVKVLSANGKRIVVAPELNHVYDENAQIGRLSAVIYYIRKTTRKNMSGASVYALYRRDLNQSSHVAQEIVEGVEKMQVKFGVRKNDRVNYLSVQQLTKDDWRHVVSVQIALLLTSIDAVSDQPKSYIFDSQEHDAADRLLRKEWDMTIAIHGPA